MSPVLDTDLAWAAGFLDADGCFTLNRHSKSLHPSGRAVHVGAVQVRTLPLIRLQEIFGGKVNRLGITSSGSTSYQWRIGRSDEVREMIPMVLPYLVLKKREAEIVLEFASTIRRGRGGGYGSRNVVGIYAEEEIKTRERLISELEGIRGRAA